MLRGVGPRAAEVAAALGSLRPLTWRSQWEYALDWARSGPQRAGRLPVLRAFVVAESRRRLAVQRLLLGLAGDGATSPALDRRLESLMDLLPSDAELAAPTSAAHPVGPALARVAKDLAEAMTAYLDLVRLQTMEKAQGRPAPLVQRALRLPEVPVLPLSTRLLLDAQLALAASVASLGLQGRLLETAATSDQRTDAEQGADAAARTVSSSATSSSSSLSSVPSAVRWTDLAALAEDATQDARAFMVEKFGACPRFVVLVEGEDGSERVVRANASPPPRAILAPPRVLTAPALVHFMVMEFLKNAARATTERHGAEEVEERGGPVVVRVRESGSHVRLSVEDEGGGSAGMSVEDAFGYFSTGTARRANPDFRYSREFGAPLSGLGIGLPRTRVTARLLGGEAGLVSLPGHGCSAWFALPSDGPSHDVSIPDLARAADVLLADRSFF